MHLSHILLLSSASGVAIADLIIAPFPGTTPNASDIKIVAVTLGGTGCPASAASAQEVTDPEVLPLPVVSFNATAGKDASAETARTNCQMLVKVQYPAGWKFGVYTADYSGYTKLPEDVLGVSKTVYYFSGETQEVSALGVERGGIGWDDELTGIDVFEYDHVGPG
jgi:hypothetical protein